MDRSRTSGPEYCSSVRAVGAVAFDTVLPSAWRNRGELRTDASPRQAVSQDSVLRQPQDGLAAWLQPQTHSAADAIDGDRGDLPKEANDLAGQGPQDLSVFAAECGDCPTRSGVEYRHHVCADATGIFVSGGHYRLVQPIRAQLAAFQHAQPRVLPRGVRRGTPCEAA